MCILSVSSNCIKASCHTLPSSSKIPISSSTITSVFSTKHVLMISSPLSITFGLNQNLFNRMYPSFGSVWHKGNTERSPMRNREKLLRIPSFQVPSAIKPPTLTPACCNRSTISLSLVVLPSPCSPLIIYTWLFLPIVSFKMPPENASEKYGIDPNLLHQRKCNSMYNELPDSDTS